MKATQNADSSSARTSKWFYQCSGNGAEPTLAGAKCSDCAKIIFPARDMCPACGARHRMSIVPLSRVGKLLGYGISLRSTEYLDAPYAFGYVMLPDGVKVYTLLVDCQPFEMKLRIGSEMEVVTGRVLNPNTGEREPVYMFRPVS